MKTLFAVALLLVTFNSFSQEFVNQFTEKYSNGKAVKYSLDYLENTEDENDEPITKLYFKYIPIAPTTDYSRVDDWSTIDLVDKKTGKRYRVVDGDHIPLSLKSAFSFYNRGGAIGFTLSFKRLPASVRNIDILSQDEVWFKDIAIDPDNHYASSFFRFSYFFTSLQFYTSVPGSTIFFTMDGYSRNDFYIDEHYSGDSRPKGCDADGIITFAYPYEMKDTEISIKAETSSDSRVRATWSLKRTPRVTTCSNFIHLYKN